MSNFKETLKDALRQVSFRTSLDKLKKKGVQDVNVLGIDRIVGLVEAAVHRSLKSRLMGVEREAVAESTKAEFLRLLRSNEDLQREKSEMERAQERAEEEIDLMRRELAQKRSALKLRLEQDSVEQANRYVGADAEIAGKLSDVIGSLAGADGEVAAETLKDRLMTLVMDVVSSTSPPRRRCTCWTPGGTPRSRTRPWTACTAWARPATCPWCASARATPSRRGCSNCKSESASSRRRRSRR